MIWQVGLSVVVEVFERTEVKGAFAVLVGMQANAQIKIALLCKLF